MLIFTANSTNRGHKTYSYTSHVGCYYGKQLCSGYNYAVYSSFLDCDNASHSKTWIIELSLHPPIPKCTPFIQGGGAFVSY